MSNKAEMTRDHYGWLWTQKEHWPQIEGIQTRIKKTIHEVKGKKVLDCGSGQGLAPIAFSRLGADSVISLDFSDKCVKQGQEFCRQYEIKNVQYIQADLLDDLPVPFDFDIIHSHGVLHHTMDCKKAFFNIAKHAKPGDSEIYVSLYWKTWFSVFWPHICVLYQKSPSFAKRIFDLILRLSLSLYDSIRGIKKHDTIIEDIHDWFGVPQRTYHSPEELSNWMIEAGFEPKIVIYKNGRFKFSSLFGVTGSR